MKNSPILFLMLLLPFSRAESTTTENNMTDSELRRTNQMQIAVLQTNDRSKVEELIKEGIDINAPIGCGTFAALDGARDDAMLKLLLAHGAKPKGRELVRIANSDSPDAMAMARTLLSAGVSPNAHDDHNITALHMAVFNRSSDMTRLLVSQPGIKIDAKNDEGETALMTAIRYDRPNTVELLLKAGANPHLANKRGETAIALAEQELEKRKALLAKLKAADAGRLAPADAGH